MVDVSDKPETAREAVAEGYVRLAPETLALAVSGQGRKGVEMEALTAVSVACLTLYDMLKAADRGMVIEDVRLLSKSGGRSGDWVRE